MKLILLLLFIVFAKISLFSQAYDPDSLFFNEDHTVWGHYKGNVKHGAWEYRDPADSKKVLKYQLYWFGELVYEDTTNIMRPPMFDERDELLRYYFGPTVELVVGKLLPDDNSSRYFCTVSTTCDTLITLQFQRVSNETEVGKIEKVGLITNRYILANKKPIPVVTSQDYRYGHLGVVYTGAYLTVIVSNKNHILKIYDQYENLVTFKPLEKHE